MKPQGAAEAGTAPVRVRYEDGAAVVVIDNPPVNVIGAAVRAGLMAALDEIEAAEVSRVIITGAGRSFVAGADAKEFGAPPAPPHLPDILLRLERLAVPTVAAINGAALGGGLEIALACRGRIAAPSATLGLPEVTLGVVPGAGGTQRLPRLIGVAQAVRLISEGRVVRAGEAKALGIVDALADDPVAAARALPVAELAARPAIDDLPAPAPDPEAAEAARAQARRRMAGQEAPLRAIALVSEVATGPIAEGLAAEREAFLALRGSDQARALRHVFFAERAAMRARGSADAVTDAVVVGGGNMGASIAYALVQAGIRVTLVEADAAGLDRARANVAGLFEQAVKRGLTTAEAAADTQGTRFAFAEGYGELPPVQVAIEAAFEDMAVKTAIFARLDAALPESAVLATNTSYLDVNAIAGGVRSPERVLGLHFFSPAHVMKLLEIVKADRTSDAALALGFGLAARLKKIPVRAGVCDGFIGNRILTRYRQICDVMLIEGALPWQVDAAMQQFGFAMGPYAVQDLSGLDIAWAARQPRGWKHDPSFRYVPVADRMVEELKRLGRKSGAGWYDYPAGTPSPVVEALILEESRRAGIARRDFTAGEIQDRALAAMIDEALGILGEGIAERPSDIDLVMIHGYAFPRWRGGLMHHADRVGLTEVLARIEAYAAADPLSWRPGALMQRLVREGRALADLDLERA
jgi:3-hydroxyacyl-CoA dehydrogenase